MLSILHVDVVGVVAANWVLFYWLLSLFCLHVSFFLVRLLFWALWYWMVGLVVWVC